MSAGTNPLLIKTFKATGTINKNNIVKFGSNDDEVVEAAAATDLVIGVAVEAAVSGGRVDVILFGIAQVVAGGTITRGNMVVSSASGTAVQQAAASGVNNIVLGQAIDSAVSGDEFRVKVNPGYLQGQ